MKRTVRLRERELRNMIAESVKRAINENLSDTIMTDGSGTYDGIPVTEIYFDNGRVCCVDEEGAVGYLTDLDDFSEEEVWNILKSRR